MRVLAIAALLVLMVQVAHGRTAASSPPPVKKPPPPASKASPPPASKTPSPPSSPPPQGHAAPGAPVFLESTSAVAPAGYRLAIVDDAVRLKAQIMAAIKVGGDGDALGDGWINGKEYGYMIMSYINPSLAKGPFMYTSLPVPSGPMFQVFYPNQTIPYGYRLASCTEASSNLGLITGWAKNYTTIDVNTTICSAQEGYVTPPTTSSPVAQASCLDPTLATTGAVGTIGCGLYTRGSTHACQFATGFVLFPGLDVNSTYNFNVQPKLANNATALLAVCSTRKACLGFDVDGNLKTALPAFNQLIPTYNDTCSGFYTQNQRAGCGLANFTFYWSYDTPSANYTQAPSNATRQAMAAACLTDSNCQGFNTAGTNKQLIQDRTQWTQWTTDACSGLYVRAGAGGV